MIQQIISSSVSLNRIEVGVNELESKIIGIVDESNSKVNFRHIKKRLGFSSAFSDKEIKAAIANLVSRGTFCYTFHFGRSFIERSLEKPIQISSHVIIKPERCSVKENNASVVVSIGKGASFGCGDHPTTRMAIQLIDHCLHLPIWERNKEKLKAADIGTGSGVLAIVAAKLGLGFVLGVDNDPCSVYEAKENVNINRLSDQIRISADSIDCINEKFDMVFANLRTPTLIALCELIHKKTNRSSILVFSGIRAEEADSVGRCYQKKGFAVIESRQEKEWRALCLMRD